MRTNTLSLLSLLGRGVTSGRTLPALHAHARVVSLSTSTHAHASTTSRPHAAATPSRSITTKTKSRGPARPMTEGERAEGPSFIVECDRHGVELPTSSGPAFVLRDAAKWSHKTAVECSITGRSFTYGQLMDGVMRFGGSVQRITGNRKENKTTIAILAPNCPEYPMVFFGGMVTGATVTPINPTYTANEIAHHLRDSEAEVLVVEAALEPLADAALNLLKKDMSVMVIGSSRCGRPNVQDIIADTNTPFATPVEVNPELTATLPYSSGTTGLPKGVCVSHRAFCNSLAIYHHPALSTFTAAEGESQEVIVGLLPFFHIYGMMVVMASGMAYGAKILTMPRFDPKLFLSSLTKHKVTQLHIVPPLLNFLATSPAVPSSVLANIHSVLCGAAPVPASSALLLKKKAARPIFFQEGFGMTETLCTHLTPTGQERLGSCGKPMPYVRAKVVDLDTGLPLPPGEKGELCIDSPGMMTGYHNKPEATRESFDEDGWFKTGDVAVYDDSGYFSIVDRMKELIKVKGLQVSPSELEDLLLSHPGVAEAGVVGVPDDKAGEVPRAYIVPQGGVKTEELQAFVSARVAPHKQLVGGIKLVEQLPKNPTGKLLRRELKRMAHGE